MKKFGLILLVLLYTSTAFSQQVPQKEVMALSLPEGAKKLTETEYLNLQAKKFKHGMIANSANHLYEREGILISYRDMTILKVLKKSLESYQKTWTYLLSRGSNHAVVTSSEIIAINNTRFLLIKYYDSTAYSIMFVSDYDKDLNFISGDVNYEKGNEEKAQQFLMELLQSMHFVN